MSKGLFLTIGELSRLTGVGISTLRSWGDKYGLLSPARSGGGFRLYLRADVERVLALKKALYVDGTPPALLQLSPEPPEPPPAPRYPATPTGASVEAPEPAGSSRCHREASRETGDERLRGQLRALRRMAAGLTHPLETGQAIEQTLVLAGSLFDADGSVVLLTGTGPAAADSPLIKYSMGTGPTQLTGADMAIHERVSRSGTTLVIPELRALGGNGSHPSDGARSMLAMPLRYADKNLGVVFVVWDRPHFFTDEEVELGTTLGALAACSIENAALFESAREAERRRGLLQEANAELARRGEAASVANELASVLSESLDIDEVLQLAVKAIVKVTGIEMAIISLLDEGTGGLVVGAHCNVPAALVEEVRHIKLGEGISGRVALTGEAIVAAADDPRSVAIIPFASRLRNRHFVCVPLWSRSKVIGTVMITSKRLQPITGEEVQLFTTIGRLTGGAVQRARAHERSVRSYYDRLVLMRDELRLMSSVRTQERLRIATELRHYVLERDLEGVGSMFEPNRGVAALQSLERELRAPVEGVPLPSLLRDAVRWRGAYGPTGRTLKIESESWPDDVPQEITLHLYTMVVRLLSKIWEASPHTAFTIRLLQDDATVGIQLKGQSYGGQVDRFSRNRLDWARLDLADVHRIADLLGGRLKIESGRLSSILTVTIPRQWDQVVRRKPMTAVVFHDQPLYGQALAKLLDDQEAVQVVDVVGSAQEALQSVRRLSPDVVVVDIGLPAMRGIDATRAIRTAFPEQRILILTPDQGQSVVEGLLAGASAFMQKTGSLLELLRAMNSVLQTESSLTPDGAERALALLAPSRGIGTYGGTIQRLTPRETEVLRLIAAGKSSKECCRILRINDKTLRRHISNMYQKLQIFDRAQLVLYAARKGLIDIGETADPDSTYNSPRTLP